MPEISIDDLRARFTFDPETGAILRLKPTQRSPIGSRADFLRERGYAFVEIDRKMVRAHRVIWALAHGEWPPKEIDHINGCRSDNRLSNLRLATRSENMANIVVSRVGKSGVRGVSWDQDAQKWYARISKNGSEIYVGLFDDLSAAHAAYVEASKKINGEFSVYARLA